MTTFGSARWQGGLKDGKGWLSTKSGALKDTPYGFAARFEGKPGANPEELIGAAHAGCFTMALSKILGESGMTAQEMSTQADVTLEKIGEDFAITKVHLTLVMAKSSPIFSRVTSAWVLISWAVMPDSPKILESAMVKQPAWAAPISSSGLAPGLPSNRAAKP